MPETPTNLQSMQQAVLGSRKGAGEPVSANPTIPDYIGQSYFDTTGANFYLATTLLASGWKKANN